MERRRTEVAVRGHEAHEWHVQPRVVGDDLRQFDGTAPAEHLARLEADQQLMLRLSLAQFTGSVWDEVARALVEYGRTVMFAWIATRVVFSKCHEKGIVTDRFGGPGRLIWGPDAEELTEDTVATAIIAFRDGVLRRGRWDPAPGRLAGDVLRGELPAAVSEHLSSMATPAGVEREAATAGRPAGPGGSRVYGLGRDRVGGG